MTFAVLTLIVGAGLLGPFLSGIPALSIPMVAGEILAGVLIGESGLKLLDIHNATLISYSNVGFAMLLFVVGSRLPVRGLTAKISNNAKRGVMAAVLSLVISIPLGIALSRITGIGHPVMFMLLCSASSTSTVLPIFAERKVTGDQASVLTVWIPICDVATMVLLPLAFGVGSTVQILIGCALVTGAGFAAFLGLKAFRSTRIGVRYRALSKQRQQALDLRLQVFILFGLAAIATNFNTSTLVAGFIAGLTSSVIGQPRRFTKQLTGIAEGLFVPLFFVYVGARINMHDLFNSTSNLELAGLIVVAGIIGHVLAGKLARLPLSTGLIASQHMGLPAAIVSMGLSAEAINGGQAAAIVTAALVSLAVCLVGMKRLPRDPNAPDIDEVPEDADPE